MEDEIKFITRFPGKSSIDCDECNNYIDYSDVVVVTVDLFNKSVNIVHIACTKQED